MGLKEGAHACSLQMPVKAAPPGWFLWRSDSFREHPTVPQVFPPVELSCSHSCLIPFTSKKIFYFDASWT